MAEVSGRDGSLLTDFDRMFELGEPPDYEPAADRSVGAMARRDGVAPAELAYDLLLGDEGRAFLYYPLHNWVDGYLHTFVAGQETYAAGEPTGALPGRLVRRGRRPG